MTPTDQLDALIERLDRIANDGVPGPLPRSVEARLDRMVRSDKLYFLYRRKT